MVTGAAKKSAKKTVVKKAAAKKSTSSKKKIKTSTTGRIVGNRRSKIYHVPGQAGYHMNSANAVYFRTETEAKRAGYPGHCAKAYLLYFCKGLCTIDSRKRQER
ncbi:hypothetical protein BTJ27_06120 [Lactobacillus delbrueckii subsp. bulgaricus]|nr:hypothetical protein [Lactobacillus delbrueckii subsp. bulgaricus]